MMVVTIKDVIHVEDIKSLKRIVNEDNTISIVDSGFNITVDKSAWNLLTVHAPVKAVTLADLD